MATIRQRKDSGMWQAIIERKGHKQQSKTFKTQVDADKWARAIEVEIDRGEFVDRSSVKGVTLGDALEDYKKVSALKDGAEQEGWRIIAWQKDELAMRPISSLTGADFRKWRDARLEVVAASTCQKDLALISHLFTTARKEWGWPVQNPIADITMPSVDNARERRFESDEELRLLRELRPIAGRSKIMIPLVQFAVETAARQSELLALKWKDVDIEGRSVLIRGKARADGKDRTKGTKGRADNQPKTRSVPLTQQAMAVLRDLAKNGVDGDSAVFQINNKVAQRCVSAACERAGIADFSFHDLRHEATSRLAGRFMMHELMKITGHKTTRMLERYYHPRVEDLAKKLD